LRFIAARTERREFPAGATLCREGERGGDFFIIADGAAEATRGGSRLRGLGRGDFFGEIALIDEGPRTATVTATSPLHCLVLAPRQFREVLAQNADIAVQILDAVTQRWRATLPAGAVATTD
jgi:CRP-like cAMP-binding protein